MFRLKTLFLACCISWGRRLFALGLIVCSVIFIVKMQRHPKIYRCYMDAEKPPNANEEQRILRDIFLSKEKPIAGQTIFFLDTQCNCSDTEYSILNFAAHEACAFESAALHHSTYEVFVLVACPTLRKETDPLLDAILSYKNVKVRYVNLWRFAEGTPIEDWLKREDLFRTKYEDEIIITFDSQSLASYKFLMVNISDLLRLLALYRYGGIYMDTDVMVLRSLAAEQPNFMGAETKTSINNGVLGLEANGLGHLVAEHILIGFQKHYSGNIWAHNGPKLLVRVMTELCGTNKITLMQKDRDRCQGIKVFDINAFYNIQWMERAYLFNPWFANKTLHRLKDSHVIHTWNHMKSNWPLRVDSESAYIQLAAKNCPKVFGATGKYFT
ncbi:hypothetical protein KR044_001769 [Drosophila immigrans]|nr:hypothetical protein KR044_001769 [Drosophila immigrans]